MSRLYDTINNVEDLRACHASDLPTIAQELREDLINNISKTGGHLGAGLGVVELSIALHYVFNTPHDKIIWDVGHQAYPHKMLTGRKDLMHTIRQKNGLSGFTKISESHFDAFGTAHSSTSISAGLGMAIARDLAGEDYSVISVIGDGAMSAGMAYEALNNAGGLKANMIVILNDNDMSIAKPVGAMSHYLSRILSSKPYVSLRHFSLSVLKKMPSIIEKSAKRAEEYMRGFVTGGTLFEELGFYYIGPIDGHNLEHLLPLLRNVKKAALKGPILLHVCTKKGKGYKPAESSDDKFHGVSQFDPKTGIAYKKKSNIPSYTQVFGEEITKHAQNDEKIVAITAAMSSGTGVNIMQQKIPSRVFDVGIAEQHAVTFAAGLAKQGFKPFTAIYSTFLQRAYDQVIHDVMLQNLPVRFVIDRAGLVGADGATHAGSFDLAYLCCLPNMVVMAPSDEHELRHMIQTMVHYHDGPIAVRFPRGDVYGRNTHIEPQILEIGKSRLLKKGSHIAVLNLGTRLKEVEKSLIELKENYNIEPTLVDMRFAKPLDEKLLRNIAKDYKAILTIEEGSSGGFATLVSNFLAKEFLLENTVFYPLYLPDRIIDHAQPYEQYDDGCLNEPHITKAIVEVYQRTSTKS